MQLLIWVLKRDVTPKPQKKRSFTNKIRAYISILMKVIITIWREEDIIKWANANNLHFIQCACRFTEACVYENKEGLSKRKETKELIRQLHQQNPNVEMNIFRSVENVNLNTIIAYKQNGVIHHFLDTY